MVHGRCACSAARNVLGEWAIISRWQSAEELDRYGRHTDPPREVLAFRGAQVEPAETVYEVIRVETPSATRGS
jgi:hypothetical protein